MKNISINLSDCSSSLIKSIWGKSYFLAFLISLSVCIIYRLTNAQDHNYRPTYVTSNKSTSSTFDVDKYIKQQYKKISNSMNTCSSRLRYQSLDKFNKAYAPDHRTTQVGASWNEIGAKVSYIDQHDGKRYLPDQKAVQVGASLNGFGTKVSYIDQHDGKRYLPDQKAVQVGASLNGFGAKVDYIDQYDGKKYVPNQKIVQIEVPIVQIKWHDQSDGKRYLPD